MENNPNHKKRIALDMDEVIADVVPKFLDFYERDFGVRPDRSAWWGKKIYQLPNAAHIRGYLNEKGFFADLPVMEGSQEVVRWLNDHFDVFAVTAATEFRNSLEDKFDWLDMHFPFIGWQRLVLCGDKRIIQADYMVDDHAWNLASFKGKGLLFTASHNLDEQRFTRVDDWAAVRAFFEKELETNRQPATGSQQTA
ncbi:MAG: 5'(3')-deoxyribonucleotidase [Bacteroidetes bacterium]|nr:5'(3')-deoxyribonucleotidase [Bacteroidota bacterium]